MRPTGGSALIADLLAIWRLKREIKENQARTREAQARTRDAQARIEKLRAMSRGAGGAQNSVAASTEGTKDTGVVAMQVGQKRHYNNGEAEFMLEPLSDSVVRVTHREQTGYFGFNRDWDPLNPYTRADYEGFVHDDGIEGRDVWLFCTPDASLQSLCDSMLTKQRKQDARLVNAEERKRAARKVLAEFVEGLPQ